jgi:hypothetical protein
MKVEPNKSNITGQAEPRTSENLMSDFDAERDRQDEFLLDALGGIPEEEVCFHTPDKLDLIDSEYRGDEIVHIYKCNCGKTVTETFKHWDTKVSE